MMKKLLALLLALAMMICLVACGEEEKTDKETPKEEGAQQEDKAPAADQEEEKEEEKQDDVDLDGQWECELNYADILNTVFVAADMPESILPSDAVTMYLTLIVEEGKIAMNSSIDEDEMNAYMDALSEKMVDYLYKECEKSGLSKEEADEKFKAEYDGKTISEYVEANIADQKSLFAEASAEGIPEYYKVEGNRIYTASTEDELDDSKEYIEFKLDGDEMTLITFAEDGEETNDPFGYGVESLQLPWVFFR